MLDPSLISSAGDPSGLGGFAEIWQSILRDFANLGEPASLTAFFQVLMIDLVLAGDNVVIMGSLSSGLPE